MVDLFVFLLLVGIILFFVSMVSPTAISKLLRKSLSRKQLAAIFGGLSVFSFVMVGVFAPPTEPEQASALTTTQTIPSVSAADTAPSVDEAPQNTNTESDTPDVAAANASASTFLVTRVVDGDTFDVDIDGKTERIRMIGIDTPETVDPRKPVQCFGKEASDKMKALISGQRVALEADPSQGERDKYDRLLRYAFLVDGRNIGLYLIQEGYAREYTYDSAYKYQQEFKAAENSAQVAKKGLWADDACPTDENPSNVESSLLNPQSSSDPSSSQASETVPSTSDGPAVKKSKSDICHAKGTQYYDQTKNYTAYDTLQACLDSGGRMPR